MDNKPTCMFCIMSQPTDEAAPKRKFEWPGDYECGIGELYYHDFAHLCRHFAAMDD